MGGCAAINCSNHSRNKFRMFKFPADEARRRKWIINCRRDGWVPGPRAELCSVHFEESQFEQHRADKWRKLKPNAVPTLFDIPNPPAMFASRRIKGSGLPKPGSVLDCASVDHVVENPDILKKWNRAISRKDKEISEKDAVCELHFTDECIEKYYETKMSDGSVYKIERGRPLLKKDSIPTIFPNLPSYLSFNEKKRKPPVDRSTSFQHEVKLDNIPQISDEPEPEENFNFSTLIKSFNEVVKPNKWWCFNFVENYVACVSWNEKYEILKKIIVDSDLHVKVFLKDQNVNFDKTTVSSIAELSTLIHTVDGFKICQNLESRSSKILPYCSGYVEIPVECSMVKKNSSILKRKKSVLLKANKRIRLATKLKGSVRRCNRLINKQQIHNSDKTTTSPTEEKKKEIPEDQFLSVATNTSSLNENKLNQSPISRTICYDSSELQISKKTDNENASDSEEEMMKNFSENSYDSSCADSNSEPLSTEEILKRKLEIMTALYEKTQKKLKFCQEQCKLYVKQIIALEEVIDNLKQINSVTDYS